MQRDDGELVPLKGAAVLLGLARISSEEWLERERSPAPRRRRAVIRLGAVQSVSSPRRSLRMYTEASVSPAVAHAGPAAVT